MKEEGMKKEGERNRKRGIENKMSPEKTKQQIQNKMQRGDQATEDMIK